MNPSDITPASQVLRIPAHHLNGSGEEHVWKKPKPIIAELKPVPAFDAETLLDPVLGAWIMDEAERMPCPADFIAAAVIVSLGSIVGAKCSIRPKANDSWLVVPNLWGAGVGDPSTMKSPAFAAAFRPLERLAAKAREEYASAVADYDTRRVVHEAQKDAIQSRIKEAARKPSKGDPSSIAEELRKHIEQAPPPPTLRRFKTNDSTAEKLGELLRENPTGQLVHRDELTGLMAGWDRPGREGERAFFLESWNGNAGFDVDRIGRGHVSIPNLCLSVFGGVQPDRLTGYLEQAEHSLSNDGLLQRLQMLVFPDRQQWEYRDRIPNKMARDDAFAIFEKLADFYPCSFGAAPADEFSKFPYFRFDEAAQSVYIAWSTDLHRVRIPQAEEPLIKQHLAKYEKLFASLALLFHLVDCLTGGVPGPVREVAALRAVAWCEYLEAHARRCYGLLKDDGLRSAQALASRLKRGDIKDGFTLRDVRRNQWRSLTTDEAIQAALDWLEDEDWLTPENSGGTGPGGGRRTIRYHINPRLSVNNVGEAA